MLYYVMAVVQGLSLSGIHEGVKYILGRIVRISCYYIMFHLLWSIFFLIEPVGMAIGKLLFSLEYYAIINKYYVAFI